VLRSVGVTFSIQVVADTYGDRKVNLETGVADRALSESVLDEVGERALEVALCPKAQRQRCVRGLPSVRRRPCRLSTRHCSALTDGSGGVLPGMLAELLDVPGATNLSAVTIADYEVSGVRSSDGAFVQLTAALPAVIPITAGTA
jgi:electron transfer flavoprotein beta subunit